VAEAHTFSDIACTVCGCVCDDLALTVAGGRITHVERACPLAEPWFEALRAAEETPRAPAYVHGALVSPHTAIDRAAAILSAAQAPLVWGLSRSSTEGQRAAVQLAETLGATVDTTASVCHGPSIMAIQAVGESTCSLGEVRHRADLVIFWGANPAVSHPRHFERYSVDPAGLFIPRGRADRTVVVVDVRRTQTAEHADLFIPVEPQRDFEAIWTLRQLIRGQEPAPGCETGAALEDLRLLAERMTRCRFGIVFFGLGLARTGLGHLNVEALLTLVAELNDQTRFTARRMRIPGDVTGADSVLCWQTGYPFAVNLARGYPRYNPGEFTANDLLERREVDACVLVGSEAVRDLSPAALEHLRRIPVIALDYPHQVPIAATVQFTTAVYGIHAAGTVYRMDEIPVPLRAVLPPGYPTDADVLSAIQSRL
jgi:formylmethanofuran dehydrogenase subunit B